MSSSSALLSSRTSSSMELDSPPTQAAPLLAHESTRYRTPLLSRPFTYISHRSRIRIFFVSAVTVCVLVVVICTFAIRPEPPPLFSRKITAASKYSQSKLRPSKTFPENSLRFNGTWDYARDARNLMMTREECDVAFPDLFRDIDRAAKAREDKKITREELKGGKRDGGYVRGMIWDNQVYILETAKADSYSRARASIHALQRAIMTSPQALPNIEFVLRPNDIVDPAHVSWAYSRHPEASNLWLAPDFGFYAWPETNIGSYGEIQHLDTALEANNAMWPWEKKQDKLVWRGVLRGKAARQDLLKHSEGKSWSEVRTVDWRSAKSRKEDFLSMPEHCQYKYVAYTEGRSYSGRLKYLQNCRSVVVAHKLEWVTHYQHLFVSNGTEQNYVQAKEDWSDLDGIMKRLIGEESLAERIAENAVKMFRERYLTTAAEVCYWRRLVEGWASVLGFEVELLEEKDGMIRTRGIPAESWFVLGDYALDGM